MTINWTKVLLPSIAYMFFAMAFGIIFCVMINIFASQNFDNKALYEGVCNYEINTEKKTIKTICEGGHERLSSHPSSSFIWNAMANSTTFCKVVETYQKEKLFRCED